jgi:hypothetical protein
MTYDMHLHTFSLDDRLKKVKNKIFIMFIKNDDKVKK